MCLLYTQNITFQRLCFLPHGPSFKRPIEAMDIHRDKFKHQLLKKVELNIGHVQRLVMNVDRKNLPLGDDMERLGRCEGAYLVDGNS